ncbi:MAG: response regulator [Legionella sp.]
MSKPLTVLIVEDMPIARLAAKAHLNQLGCVVDTADDAETALKMVNDVQYDAILMDLSLGQGPDGFEVTHLIKTQSLLNKNTPIIALTIYSESEFNEKARSVGIIDFIYKPFTLTEAKELVESIRS